MIIVDDPFFIAEKNGGNCIVLEFATHFGGVSDRKIIPWNDQQ